MYFINAKNASANVPANSPRRAGPGPLGSPVLTGGPTRVDQWITLHYMNYCIVASRGHDYTNYRRHLTVRKDSGFH